MKYCFVSSHCIECNFEVDLKEDEVEDILTSLILEEMNTKRALNHLKPTLKAKITRSNRKAIRIQLSKEQLPMSLCCRFDIKNNQDIQEKLPQIEKLLMAKDRKIDFPLELSTQAWFLFLNDLHEVPSDKSFIYGQYMAVRNLTFGENSLVPIYLTRVYLEKPYYQKMFYFDGFKYQGVVSDLLGERNIFEEFDALISSSELGYMYELFVLLYDHLLKKINDSIVDRRTVKINGVLLSVEDNLWLASQDKRDIRRLQRIASYLGVDYNPEHLVKEIQDEIHSTTPEIYTLNIPQIWERHRKIRKGNGIFDEGRLG